MRNGWRDGWVAAVPLAALALGPYRGGLFAQYALLAAATALLALAWGYGGMLSLGHSIPFGIGAYATGWFSAHAGGAGTLVGLGVGALIAGAVSFAIGFFGLRGKTDVIALALITFISVLGAAYLVDKWTNITGGFNGLNDVPLLHAGKIALSETSQRVVVCIVSVLVLLAAMIVARSPFGAALQLVRDSPRRAGSLGYNVPALRIATFTAVGLVTGLLGGLYATQTQSVGKTTIDITLATSFVVWAMLGSITSLPGAYLAALAYKLTANELGNRLLDKWLLTTGLAFTLVVLVIPAGIGATIAALVPARWRRRTTVQLRVDSVGAAELPVPTRDVVLRATDITCRFGPFVAVDGVDMDVYSGDVHCLIGPNGAGKSTLLDVLSGLRIPAGGRWRVDARELGGRRPWTMARAGVARKFQAPAIGPTLTVGQNLVLASLGPRHSLWSLWRAPWSATLTPQSWEVLRMAGLADSMDRPAGSLSHGQRQLLELAMTLATPSRILMLDEPTAGMTRPESDEIGIMLRQLAVKHGTPVLMVEHDMELVRGAAHRITVLRDGAVIADGSLTEIESDAAVREAYLGSPG